MATAQIAQIAQMLGRESALLAQID